MGSGHNRPAVAGRFQKVLPAGSGQGLADKNQIGRRIKIPQLSGGIHQQEVRVGRLPLAQLGTLRHLQPRGGQLIQDAARSLHMPGHEHQTELRMTDPQFLSDLRQDQLLPRMGTASQKNNLPTVPPRQLPHLSPLPRLVRGKIGHVVFHASHKMQMVFGEPGDGEALHVLRTLDPDPVE